MRRLRLGADQGHAGAQCSLAIRCLHGKGVARDLAEGARLVQLAADQGHAHAQRLLDLATAASTSAQERDQRYQRHQRDQRDQPTAAPAAVKEEEGGWGAFERGPAPAAPAPAPAASRTGWHEPPTLSTGEAGPEQKKARVSPVTGFSFHGLVPGRSRAGLYGTRPLTGWLQEPPTVSTGDQAGPEDLFEHDARVRFRDRPSALWGRTGGRGCDCGTQRRPCQRGAFPASPSDVQLPPADGPEVHADQLKRGCSPAFAQYQLIQQPLIDTEEGDDPIDHDVRVVALFRSLGLERHLEYIDPGCGWATIRGLAQQDPHHSEFHCIPLFDATLICAAAVAVDAVDAVRRAVHVHGLDDVRAPLEAALAPRGNRRHLPECQARRHVPTQALRDLRDAEVKEDAGRLARAGGLEPRVAVIGVRVKTETTGR